MMNFHLLINIAIVLIIAGVALHFINQYIPMAASIKALLNLIVVIAVILWVLSMFGIVNLHSLMRFKLK